MVGSKLPDDPHGNPSDDERDKDRPKQMADLSNVASFCLSDGIVDSRGGMYVGDVGFDFLDPLVDPVPNGVIVHLSAGGRLSVVAKLPIGLHDATRLGQVSRWDAGPILPLIP